ncbi:MAG TPA: hypothetical protein EYP14_06605, partial [Planctomycetaceae bacterium]|nr:hypothetical protein [Planctomycetaceae bacterium]
MGVDPIKTGLVRIGWLAGALLLTGGMGQQRAATAPQQTEPPLSLQPLENLELAIRDLMETFGERYPSGQEYLHRLQTIRVVWRAGRPDAHRRFLQLRREVLLANPLLDFDRLIVLKRCRGQLALPANHQCNSCLKQTGYDNEIDILSPVHPGGFLTTLFRPRGGFYVGELDLHYDADRLLFTMPNGRTWQIHEIRVDGTGLRQVSREEPDVDNFDACYLPDGGIVYASTASFTAVPCWHGRERACSLFRMNADGSAVRQLCFDQDIDLHPSVLPSGQIVYSRWDYTGLMHIYARPLMVMNPDGTGQRAIYGTNSYYPNALYFPRAIPGQPHKLVAVLSGYHGVRRAGDLVVIDTSRGWHGADGLLTRVTHRLEPIRPVIRDRLVDENWPKFLHPYPLSDKYFLVSAQLRRNGSWGIYLVDVFDNMLAIQVDPRFDFFEPIPVKKTSKPPVIPSRVDLERDDAVIYLHDIYRGPGLAGVPRGTVKRLRIVAYHFGFPGLAGPDKVGRAGPWEVMRILGTVPVYEDGSALFRVPANTPLAVQPLDEEGKALQLMRSWYTAMPGETVSCVGCHERPPDSPEVRTGLAALGPPSEIEPWYGPPRGFDFEREVQPVLDRKCVGCHNGQPQPDGRTPVDLRARRFVPDYVGLPLSKLGADRLDPEIVDRFPPCEPPHKLLGRRRMLYTPAYEALIPFIRRVNIEDDVGMLVPAEYHADTSELIQMLRKGHHGVRLDREAWDRLITWIDLNGPCFGTWSQIAPVRCDAARRRLQMLRRSGGPEDDPERLPEVQREPITPIVPPPETGSARPVRLDGWPFDRGEARWRQRAAGSWKKRIELAEGITLELVRVPAGRFVMGEWRGEPDERPAAVVTIENDFWMSACEITNEQFRLFDPGHDSRVFTKRSLDENGPGVAMNQPKQPVVPVSWQQAM